MKTCSRDIHIKRGEAFQAHITFCCDAMVMAFTEHASMEVPDYIEEW